jgi:hypothetical protein
VINIDIHHGKVRCVLLFSFSNLNFPKPNPAKKFIWIVIQIQLLKSPKKVFVCLPDSYFWSGANSLIDESGPVCAAIFRTCCHFLFERKAEFMSNSLMDCVQLSSFSHLLCSLSNRKCFCFLPRIEFVIKNRGPFARHHLV